MPEPIPSSNVEEMVHPVMTREEAADLLLFCTHCEERLGITVEHRATVDFFASVTMDGKRPCIDWLNDKVYWESAEVIDYTCRSCRGSLTPDQVAAFQLLEN